MVAASRLLAILSTSHSHWLAVSEPLERSKRVLGDSQPAERLSDLPASEQPSQSKEQLFATKPFLWRLLAAVSATKVEARLHIMPPNLFSSLGSLKVEPTERADGTDTLERDRRLVNAVPSWDTRRSAHGKEGFPGMNAEKRNSPEG